MSCSTVVNSEVVESTPVRSSSSISSMRGQRRRPRDESDSIDLAIFEELRDSRKRREMRAETESNAAMSFGRHVGERLNKMTPHLRAMAEVKIQQVLLDIEFPPDQVQQVN